MQPLIDPYRRTRIRASLAEWMSREQFTHAITLIPNRHDLSQRSISKLFGTFCHEIDREKLARQRPRRAPSSERFEALAMPEKMISNPHLHLVADLEFMIDRGLPHREVTHRIYVAWKKATRGSGDVDVQRHYGREWPWYITKEALDANHAYFLASDFHPV